MSPLASVNQAYAMVISYESQRSVGSIAAILHSDPISIGYECAMFTKGTSLLCILKKMRWQCSSELEDNKPKIQEESISLLWSMQIQGSHKGEFLEGDW